MLQLNFLAELDTTPLDSSIIFPDDNRYDSFIKKWQSSKFFCLDIETTGNNTGDGLNPFAGKIRLIQIALPKCDDVLVVDMFKTVPVTFLDTLKTTCESTTQHQIGHNIQFDLTWLQHHLGIESNNPYCTRIMSVLRWCGIKWVNNKGQILPMSHSLSGLAERLFGIKVDKTEQASAWHSEKLSNSQINYAAEDVRITLKCFLELANQISKLDSEVTTDLTGLKPTYSLMDIVKVECNAIPVFVEIFLTGQPIDLDYAGELRQQYLDAMEDLYQPAYDLLGLPFSASSDKLCSAIWHHLNIALIQEVKDEDDDDVVKTQQLQLLGKKPPELQSNEKLSTSSANLFYHYTQTNNDILLRISLTRSLKKAVDSLDALIESAKQNDGYAKGYYTSLGSTGSGRSTCKGGGKNSSLKATNLQNIAGVIEHPLVEAYNLPPVRTIITDKNLPDSSMWLVDLAASHLRIAAKNSGDTKLVEILDYKDSHSLVTQQMMLIDGKEVTREYCEENKKTPEVAYYRAIAKTSTYTLANDGYPKTYQQALLKAFVNVSLSDCEKAREALIQTFVNYCQDYSPNLQRLGKSNIVKVLGKNYVRYRTHDGRLFHVEVFESSFGPRFKLGEITSSMLISPEAIAMKKAGVNMLGYLRSNRNLPIKLLSFTHDDYSGIDATEDKRFLKYCYTQISGQFSKIVPDGKSGMPVDDKSIMKCCINNYSEK